MAVGVADLPGQQRPIALDELIAGGEHADARPGVHLHREPTERGEHAEMSGRQHDAGREHELAGAHVLAGVAHGRTRFDRTCDVHRGAIGGELGDLDHDGRVGARRHRRAGHDAHRLALVDRAVERGARGQRADHPQGHRHLGDVGRAHREAVDRGVRERRDGLGCDDLLGEHQAEGAPQRNRRGRAHAAPGQHVLACVFQRDHAAR